MPGTPMVMDTPSARAGADANIAAPVRTAAVVMTLKKVLIVPSLIQCPCYATTFAVLA